MDTRDVITKNLTKGELRKQEKKIKLNEEDIAERMGQIYNKTHKVDFANSFDHISGNELDKLKRKAMKELKKETEDD